MLDVSNISVSYGAHRALEDASVCVSEGEIVVILGANGAGKSSLLKAIAGTCEGQTQGDVELGGLNLDHLPAEQIVTRGIAFVPEGRGIFGDLTVGENLQLGAHAKEARARQDESLARVYKLFPKLKERHSQVARTMSGGEQQMVAIGRAMMANPKILMLDEPSLGLSPLLCKELFQNLSHIRETGIGVLMVEQNAKQSLAIADRAYLLENGTITGENSAQAMMNDPAVQAAYLGGAKGTPMSSVTGSANHDRSKVKTHIITPGGDGPTDEPPSHTYIQAARPDNTAKSSDTFAGVDIGSLVARASSVADRKSGQRPSIVPNSPAHGAVSRAENGAVSSKNSSSVPVHVISPDDADVQKLLSEFETAAVAARSSSQENSKRGNGSPAKQHDESLMQHERLPEIPVYRKTKLEIYRRTASGDLMKAEET